MGWGRNGNGTFEKVGRSQMPNGPFGRKKRERKLATAAAEFEGESASLLTVSAIYPLLRCFPFPIYEEYF